MAMSGTLATPSSGYYLNVEFDWSVWYDTSAMKAHWTVSATVKRTAYGSYSKNFATRISGDDIITFNNVAVWSMSPGNYQGRSLNPYVYTGDRSVCAERVSPSVYSGTLSGKYPYGLAHLLTNYTFDTNIDENGRTSLAIGTVFTGAEPSNISEFSSIQTIVPDTADIYSKVKYVSGQTGNWTDAGKVWEKTSATNNTWVKRKFYRKTGAGASGWVKV